MKYLQTSCDTHNRCRKSVRCLYSRSSYSYKVSEGSEVKQTLLILMITFHPVLIEYANIFFDTFFISLKINVCSVVVPAKFLTFIRRKLRECGKEGNEQYMSYSICMTNCYRYEVSLL